MEFAQSSEDTYFKPDENLQKIFITHENQINQDDDVSRILESINL